MICRYQWTGRPTEAVNRLADKLKVILTADEIEALIRALQAHSDGITTITAGQGGVLVNGDKPKKKESMKNDSAKG